MLPEVTLQQTTLATASADKAACLIFVEGELAAIFSRLDDEVHQEDRGSWFLEVGFGWFEVSPPPVFRTIEAAQRWAVELRTRRAQGRGQPAGTNSAPVVSSGSDLIR